MKCNVWKPCSNVCWLGWALTFEFTFYRINQLLCCWPTITDNDTELKSCPKPQVLTSHLAVLTECQESRETCMKRKHVKSNLCQIQWHVCWLKFCNQKLWYFLPYFNIQLEQSINENSACQEWVQVCKIGWFLYFDCCSAAARSKIVFSWKWPQPGVASGDLQLTAEFQSYHEHPASTNPEHLRLGQGSRFATCAGLMHRQWLQLLYSLWDFLLATLFSELSKIQKQKTGIVEKTEKCGSCVRHFQFPVWGLYWILSRLFQNATSGTWQSWLLTPFFHAFFTLNSFSKECHWSPHTEQMLAYSAQGLVQVRCSDSGVLVQLPR